MGKRRRRATPRFDPIDPLLRLKVFVNEVAEDIDGGGFLLPGA